MPEERPLVTVVTVTYNSGRFIRDAIDSILCSSYEHLELIVGDDCSQDDTWDIVQSYSDDRIRAYRNEKNLGEYPNRNKALFMAKGEYLIFIDGDDMVYPHGLEFMVKMLHAFPNCGMALMRWYKKNLFFPVEITPVQLYQGIYFGYGFNDMAFSNVFFRTHLLREDGGLTEVYKNGDDHARLRVGAKANTLLINDNLTWWRETSGQASSQLNNKVEGKVLDFNLKKHFLELEGCPLKGNEHAVAIKNLKISVVKTASQYLRRLNLTETVKLIKETGISFIDLVFFMSKPIYKDPFSLYTPDNPMRSLFEKNPYARIPD